MGSNLRNRLTHLETIAKPPRRVVNALATLRAKIEAIAARHTGDCGGDSAEVKRRLAWLLSKAGEKDSGNEPQTQNRRS